MLQRNRRLILILPTVIAGAVLLVLLNWHVPTHVLIELKVNKTAFRVGGTDTTRIVEGLGLKSVAIQDFSAIKLTPAKLVSPAPDETQISRKPDSINGVVKAQPMIITPAEGRAIPNIALSVPVESKTAVFLIDAIVANAGSDVSLETTEDGDLVVRLQAQQPSGKITSSGPLILGIDQSQVSGALKAVQPDEQTTWLLELAKDSSIEFIGQEKALTLAITAPTEVVSKLFSEGRIPVASVRFETIEDSNGTPRSTLLKGSQSAISYPDYKNIDKAVVSSPDFLSLDSLEKFSIEEIKYDANEKAIALKLQGIAGKIVSGSSDYRKDHRLTLYDSIWNNHKIIALFVTVCWVGGATSALYKHAKES